MRRPAAQAAAGTLAVFGTLAAVGVAGAEESSLAEYRITVNQDEQKFVTPNGTQDYAIVTGDTITWDFAPNGIHNAAGETTTSDDPNWAGRKFKTPIDVDGSYTFYRPGAYEYLCEVHEIPMRGIITVTGEPKPIPTATPVATATPSATTPAATATPVATATPAATATPFHVTPPPSARPVVDRAAPGVRRIALKTTRRGARVSFRLSETSTVTLALKRGKKVVVKAKTFQMRAGARTVTIGRARLPLARYTVEVRARDRFGNSTAVLRKTSRIGLR